MTMLVHWKFMGVHLSVLRELPPDRPKIRLTKSTWEWLKVLHFEPGNEMDLGGGHKVIFPKEETK